MGFGAIIIGDEILRGKRQDKHFTQLVSALGARGLHLDWSLVLGDNRPRLIETFRHTLASTDVVFSFGGIGITPDDHTRQSVAAAAGVALQLHPDAEAEIRARLAETGAEVTPQRLQLGEFPLGSRIVPNAFNRMPGFSFADHHCFPGFPQMAWPMLEWVLERYYHERFHAVAETEQAILVWEGFESVLLGLMQQIEARYPNVSLFSLPFLGSAMQRRHIELGLRGDPEQVVAGMQDIRAGVTQSGYKWDEITPSTKTSLGCQP